MTDETDPVPAATRTLATEKDAEAKSWRIGPYRVLRELGHGGMGSVYLAARDEAFQKRVAIKLVRSGDHREAVLRRFVRERQILAGLDHPHIAKLLDGGTTTEGLPYLVMDYIEGDSIDRYCDSHELSVEQRLRLFLPVCEAVAFAHRNLVVHRDLKPSNIFVTSAGVPKLLDFGIAKLLLPEAAGDPLTGSHAVMMTPPYASPEQVRGRTITTASDTYSLGVVLYELMTGRRPYRLRTADPLDLLRAVCEQEPERPSTAVSRTDLGPAGDAAVQAPFDPAVVSRTREGSPDRLRRRLRGDIDTIVLMALRKEPERRYATVDAFAEDIRRHLAGRPVSARKGTFSYRTGKFLRRHWLGAVAAALVVTLVVGFGVVAATQSRRIARERDKAARLFGFMLDLFKVSNPSEARGNTVTAREVLDKAADRIPRDLAGDPETKAGLMSAIARAYGSLGLYARAEPLLEEALRLRRQTLGSEHPDVAAALSDLATLLWQRGELGRAELLHREALARRRRSLGDEHVLVAASRNDLAEVLADKGDYAGAETLFREALAQRRRLLGARHVEVAQSLNSLAWVLRENGNYATAEPLFREALAMRRELLGNDHPAVSASVNNLAVLLRNRGDYAAAASLHRENLALARRLYGNDHPDAAKVLNNLANVLHDMADYRGAEPLHREALAIRRKTLGSVNADAAQSMNNLAISLRELGDATEAESLHREALEVRRTLFPNGHPDVAQTLMGLGTVLEDRGERAQAERCRRESVDLLRRFFAPDHPALAEALVGLAANLARSGRAAEAEPLAREAVEIGRRKPSLSPLARASGEGVLGECLARLGRFDEAEALLRESERVMADKGSASLRGRAHEQLAWLYEAWGKPEEGRRYRALARAHAGKP